MRLVSTHREYSLIIIMESVIKIKGHLPWPHKNVLNFSLEEPTIFSLAPYSCNYPSHSFLCISKSAMLLVNF